MASNTTSSMGKIIYGELKHGATNMLASAGIENPALDVRMLLEKASGKTAAELIICDHDAVPKRVQIVFRVMLGQRLAYEPIAYIIGEKAFWSLDFMVNERVLIPRPETEGLVEYALELIADIPAPHIVDVGTGCGAVLISLLHERMSATGVGVDIAPKALAVAAANAQRHDVSHRCNFLRSDYLSAVKEKFDIVVSNPPYIDEAAMKKLAPDVKNYEPETALYGGKDGLTAYRVIISQIKTVLKPGGYLVFEIGFDQKQPVSDLLTKVGATNIICQQDLADKDRILSAKF